MSAGRDVRGIKRGHQFDKVGDVQVLPAQRTRPRSQKMVADAEETCQQLGLTYRVLLQSTGDLSFGSHKTYDLEVWAPGCQEWLEGFVRFQHWEFQAR